MRTTPVRPLLASLGLALGVALAGCAGSPGIPMADFTANDYRFDGPDQMVGGLTGLRLANAGHEAHHVAIARLDPGHTLAEFTALLASNATEGDAPWAHWVGGAGPFMPGGSGIAYMDLQAGTYVLVCFVPDAQGVPHFAHGMVKQVTVTAPNGAKPDPPAADLTLTETEFHFAFDKAPTAGTHTIKVQNQGGQVHEAILAKLDDGATPQEFVAAFGPNATGPPPGAFVGGFSEQDPGRTGYFTVTLTPGRHVLICFVSDPGSHAPHFALGMLHEFTV